jgi:Holliday junction resolvase RusA-like endonuclease
MFHFEFTIDGPPVSQQTRNKELRRQWTAKVRSVAAQSWPSEESLFSDPVIVRISWFYENISMDVDNIPKPIIDGLKGLVFLDDNVVTDLVCQKRNLNEEFSIRNPSPILAEGISRREDFLYIVVEEAPDQRMIL